jgi:7,8-dihydro-6-hydroxymethylpterin-pyrophosphokinase
LYGQKRLSTRDLTIPDPEIWERSFLAVPLYEIEPKLLLPDTKEPIKKTAKKLKREKMVELRDATVALEDLIASLAK